MIAKEAGHPSWRDSLWDYSVRIYSLPQVEKLSLDLQDSYKANVNIILWCCWLRVEGICLPREALNEAFGVIDTVSRETVLRLREVRRHLKELGGFTRVQTKLISNSILEAELMIEKVLLQRLQDITYRFVELEPGVGKPLSLMDYLQFLEIPDAEYKSSQFYGYCDVPECEEL